MDAPLGTKKQDLGHSTTPVGPIFKQSVFSSLFRLIEEITNLEKRQKELVNILARVDPEMAAQRLQDQLEALQEKNRQLRSANGLSPNPVRPDSGIQNPGIQQQNPELALEEDSVDSEVMIVTSKSQPSPRESPDSSTKE